MKKKQEFGTNPVTRKADLVRLRTGIPFSQFIVSTVSNTVVSDGEGPWGNGLSFAHTNERTLWAKLASTWRRRQALGEMIRHVLLRMHRHRREQMGLTIPQFNLSSQKKCMDLWMCVCVRISRGKKYNMSISSTCKHKHNTDVTF